MNRREAIYNFMVLSAGTVLLQSCGGGNETAAVTLKNFSLTGAEGQMMTQLADLIIPKTTFIGAADLKATEFTLKMVDDCYPPEKQKVFKDGLQQFDKLVKDKYVKSFIDCTDAQKKEWLGYIESKKDIPENVASFYQTIKRHTVQAFTSSKEYLTDVVHYKMVPGSNFKGCVPVSKA